MNARQGNEKHDRLALTLNCNLPGVFLGQPLAAQRIFIPLKLLSIKMCCDGLACLFVLPS